MKQRSRMDLMISILEAANAGAGETTILYRTKLDPEIAEKYLDFLINQNMLEVKSAIYKTTEYGRKYLVRAKEVKKSLLWKKAFEKKK